MGKNTYITVLTTDSYIQGVLCLVESLRKTNTKYPITVMITDEISKNTEKILNNYGLNVIRKNKMNISKNIKEKNAQGDFSHWSNTFDKLQIFELTQFDKMVYIDSDMYIRKNIDELFERENMSATIDRPTGPVYNPEFGKRLTSGLMVIEPTAGILQEFKKVISNITEKKISMGDQDILQEYDKDWGTKEKLHLDFKYNMFFAHLDYFTHYFDYTLDDIYGIHFILKNKPFDFKANEMKEYIKYIERGKRRVYTKYKDLFEYNYIECGSNDEMIILEEYMEILKEVRKKLNISEI